MTGGFPDNSWAEMVAKLIKYSWRYIISPETCTLRKRFLAIRVPRQFLHLSLNVFHFPILLVHPTPFIIQIFPFLALVTESSERLFSPIGLIWCLNYKATNDINTGRSPVRAFGLQPGQVARCTRRFPWVEPFWVSHRCTCNRCKQFCLSSLETRADQWLLTPKCRGYESAAVALQ